MNIFYLHVSARQCAMMMNDNDALVVQRFAGHLLSNAVHLTIGESCKYMWPYRRVSIPHQAWVNSSADNFLWVYDLFRVLEERNAYKRKGGFYELNCNAHRYLDWFPNSPFTEPPSILRPVKYSLDSMTEVQRWRFYYAVERRRPYKRVPKPFWI